MRQSWTQGLEPERAKDVRANFKESLVMRRRLLELLEKKIDASVKMDALSHPTTTPTGLCFKRMPEVTNALYKKY